MKKAAKLLIIALLAMFTAGTVSARATNSYSATSYGMNKESKKDKKKDKKKKKEKKDKKKKKHHKN